MPASSQKVRLNSVEQLALAVLIATLWFFAATLVLGVHLEQKPGAFVLGSVLLIALTQYLWSVMRTARARLYGPGIAFVGLICFAYFTAYQFTSSLLSGNRSGVCCSILAVRSDCDGSGRARPAVPCLCCSRPGLN